MSDGLFVTDEEIAKMFEDILLGFQFTFASRLADNKPLFHTDYNDGHIQTRLTCAEKNDEDSCEKDKKCKFMSEATDEFAKAKKAAKNILDSTFIENAKTRNIENANTRKRGRGTSREELINTLLGFYTKGACLRKEDISNFSVDSTITILQRKFRIVYRESADESAMSTSKCVGLIEEDRNENILNIGCRAFDMQANIRKDDNRLYKALKTVKTQLDQLFTATSLLCDSPILYGQELKKYLFFMLSKYIFKKYLPSPEARKNISRTIHKVCDWNSNKMQIGIRKNSLLLSEHIFRKELLETVIRDNNINTIKFYGFSQGGPTAHILAFFTHIFIKPEIPNLNISFTTLGAPRAGNKAFCTWMGKNMQEAKNITVGVFSSKIDNEGHETPFLKCDPAATAPRQNSPKEKDKLYNVEPNYIFLNVYNPDPNTPKANQVFVGETANTILANGMFTLDCATHIAGGVQGFIKSDATTPIRSMIAASNAKEKKNQTGTDKEDISWWQLLHNQFAYIATCMNQKIPETMEDVEKLQKIVQ